MTTTAQARGSDTVLFLTGFGVLYVVLAGLAELDATGRYGVAILAAVLFVAVVIERLLGGAGVATATRNLGLGRPTARAVLVALGLALLLQAVYPIVTAVTGATFSLKPGWPWLLVSIFAFNGLAEELVWRGYAFRRLRQGRSFGAAVLLSMPLIAATHIPILASSGLAVGLAAMLVAAVTSLPFAHLFELGRNTVWAAAIVHTGVDGFKVVNVSDDARLTFSLILSAISIAVPLLALAARPKPEHPKPRQENGK